MIRKTSPLQLDLFAWAEARPSTIIDARHRFEAKVIAFVVGMINDGGLPPPRDGQLIKAQFRQRGAA